VYLDYSLKWRRLYCKLTYLLTCLLTYLYYLHTCVRISQLKVIQYALQTECFFRTRIILHGHNWRNSVRRCHRFNSDNSHQTVRYFVLKNLILKNWVYSRSISIQYYTVLPGIQYIINMKTVTNVDDRVLCRFSEDWELSVMIQVATVPDSGILSHKIVLWSFIFCVIT
jgi:hypothetical protein